jgi:hypothetical protein
MQPPPVRSAFSNPRALRRSPITLFAIAVAAVLGSASESRALPVTQPTGLNPGDQYRLVFVTTTSTTANLPGGIAAYNAIVQAEAASEPSINALGTTWHAVGSTAAVDARTNTGTDPPYRPWSPITPR